tara:strand:+ start:2265 stop:2411 length:147 start_codon:yes stop_codon:yes gene_type:complete
MPVDTFHDAQYDAKETITLACSARSVAVAAHDCSPSPDFLFSPAQLRL